MSMVIPPEHLKRIAEYNWKRMFEPSIFDKLELVMSDPRKATAERTAVQQENESRNAQRYTYICEYCGSDNIGFEAFVYWDVEKQEFCVSDTCDKGHTCGRCGVECRTIEIKLRD